LFVFFALLVSNIFYCATASLAEVFMSPRVVKRADLILVAGGPDEFSRVSRASGFAQRNGVNVVPLLSSDEVLQALNNASNILIVINSQADLDRHQEDLVHAALARGAHWCSVNFFEGCYWGFARVKTLGDILEWMHLTEQSIFSIFSSRILCCIRRVSALAALVSLSPLLILIAFVIRQVSPGPVFYKQQRVGHKGKAFTLVKFRTMHVDSERLGPQWSSGNSDSRAFPFGRFLRQTHLDELPQLWNVVKGELCFVGPRPERPEFYTILREELPHFAVRARIAPGITGWAQLRAGYAASVDESRRKMEFDLYFMRSVRLAFVFEILIGTINKCGREVCSAIFAILRRRNANE
jgi:lipopolysaccharide/colanic/teichoic acid biosynthesis glycosyltransferase